MIKDFTGELIKKGATKGEISIYQLKLIGKSKEHIAKLLFLTQKTVDDAIDRINELLMNVTTELTEKTNDIISKQEQPTKPNKILT